MKKPGCAAAIVLLLTSLLVPEAQALRTQERPDWQVGIGLGYGRGSFENPAGARAAYRNGPAFQLRCARSLSSHFMLGAYYDTWMIEYGEVPTKFRNVQQGLGLGLSWFPGRAGDPTNGIFLRASGGMGWIGLAEKPAIPGEAQGEGERTDEWGYNVVVDSGYEFWIGRKLTAGLGACFGYLGIGATNVERAGFAALLLDLNLYF